MPLVAHDLAGAAGSLLTSCEVRPAAARCEAAVATHCLPDLVAEDLGWAAFLAGLLVLPAAGCCFRAGLVAWRLSALAAGAGATAPRRRPPGLGPLAA